MDTNNNLLWKSLSDSTTKLEYGLSSILLVALLSLCVVVFLGKDDNNIGQKNASLAVVLLTSAFLAVYTSIGIVSSVVEDDVETVEASDERYKYMSAAIAISIPVFSIIYYALSKIFEGKLPFNLKTETVFYFSLIYGSLAYTAFGVIYIIYDMYKGDNYFPLYSKYFKETDDSKIDLDVLLGSIFAPLVFFFFSLFSFLIFKFFGLSLFTSEALYVFIPFTVIFGAIYAGLYFSDSVNNKIVDSSLGFSLVGLASITIFITSVHLYLKYKTAEGKFSPKDSERYMNFLMVISSVVLLLWSLGASITYSIRENNFSRDKEYSIYLVSTTIAIIFSILACLFFLVTIKNNPDFDKIIKNGIKFNFNSIVYYTFFVLALGALVLSVSNLIMTSNQKIDNSSSLDNTNYENYNEIEYELLNLGMSFGYVCSTLVSFILVCYMGLKMLGGNEEKDLLDFFTLKDINNTRFFNFMVVVLFSGFVALLSYYISYYSTTSEKVKYENLTSNDKHDFLKYVAYPAIVLFVLGCIEIWVDSSRLEDDRTTFFPKIYRLIIFLMPFLLPLTSLVLFLVGNPKFFRKLSDGDSQQLIFGNSNSKNSLAIDHGKRGDESIFSTRTNFANYGNGLLLTGGETNLDIEAIRGIRYVSNQGGYFNFKYLDSDLESFDFIVKDNSVNIFTLATNDAAFGKVNTIGDQAFWVAVGENVGLTDSVNNSIFYNLTAGANSFNTIPNITTINDWKAATNTFSYRGNGVVSGIAGGQNRWVAVGQDKVDYPLAGDSFDTIKYSDDGKTWVNASGVSFSSFGNKVAFSPAGLNVSGGTATNRFVAVGSDYINNNNILYSNDGATWSATTGPQFTKEGKDVAYGLSGNGTSGIWVAVGIDDTNPIKYSVNGGTVWQNADGVSLTNEEGGIAVTYNLAKTRFEVVGKANKTTDASFLYFSTNGSSWTADNRFPEIIEGTAITYNGGVSPVDNYGDKYDQIYYPTYNDNKYFFVKKRSNGALNLFSYIFYGSFIAISLLLYLSLYYLRRPIQGQQGGRSQTQTQQATGGQGQTQPPAQPPAQPGS